MSVSPLPGPTPTPTDPRVAGLRARDRDGWLHSLGLLGLMTVALGLASPALDPGSLGSPARILGWLLGQGLIALGFLKAFSVLHEAGHHTLFATRALNTLVGQLCSVLTMIPYTSWREIHRKHHTWTGWQDKDPTTAGLVPRPLSRLEQVVLNFAWRTWIPLFSVLYRAQSFWNLPRLLQLFPEPALRRRLVLNLVGLLVVYVGLVVLIGPAALFVWVGPGLLLGLSWMDVLMLSQHTHIPMRVAGGASVSPFPPAEQVPYTRSLGFPGWISVPLLTGFDAHELHHALPLVPGPRLREIGWAPPNEAPAWSWIRAAKSIPATVFLFQNRDSSGLSI